METVINKEKRMKEINLIMGYQDTMGRDVITRVAYSGNSIFLEFRKMDGGNLPREEIERLHEEFINRMIAQYPMYAAGRIWTPKEEEPTEDEKTYASEEYKYTIHNPEDGTFNNHSITYTDGKVWILKRKLENIL
jgi:hypothetical protein